MYPQWQCSCSQQDEGVTVVHIHREVGGEEVSEVLTVSLGWESHMVDAIVMLCVCMWERGGGAAVGYKCVCMFHPKNLCNRGYSTRVGSNTGPHPHPYCDPHLVLKV